MLRIVAAHRVETLVERLLQALDEPPASPFDAEHVIVPSAAMRRYLALRIAGHRGICANVRFSYLAHWLWERIRAFVPAVPEESPFAAEVIVWRILPLLQDRAFVAPHPRLAGYVGDADPQMLHELSCRIAQLFEQYVTYRPEWLAAWAAGRSAGLPVDGADTAVLEDEAWQAALWRRLRDGLGRRVGDPIAEFFHAVETDAPGEPAGTRLPRRAQVFCLPSMPPLYIRMLHRLGRWMDLDLLVLNPCREYWFEIVDRRTLSWLRVRDAASHHEVGNRLLAACGKQTQAHLDLLLTEIADAVIDDAGFDASGSATLLGRVQDAILELREIDPRSVGTAADGVLDRSIEVHSCHSLAREVEVLHDQLLAIFAAADRPRADEVLVVTPDLERAAPLVDAVFGNAPRERFIPYAISGRARSAANAPSRVLLALLRLARSRFTANEVFDLLQQPAVARRFDLDGDALAAIHRWIRKASIHWGLDPAQREELDLAAAGRVDFATGIDRLLLGYALADSVTEPWGERWPAGGAEGSEALALGAFARFVDELARARERLAQPLAARAWIAQLVGLLDAFVAPHGDDGVDELRETRAAIGELERHLARAGFDAELTLDVVRAALQSLLDDPGRGGMPTGVVTFTSMASLRNLPYAVVCVIGLDDGAFPAPGRSAEFDLIAACPRRGDRQRRTDERNLFLDLLLAARQRFHVSYSGRSARDNAPLPPSVLVSELLEFVGVALAPGIDGAGSNPRDAARRQLVVEHPLQAFSPSAFSDETDPRRRSYNAEYCAAIGNGLARRLTIPLGANAEAPGPSGTEEADAETEDQERASLQAPWQRPPFFEAALADPGAHWRDVDLGDLARFFRNPCRYLLRERLGIDLGRDAEPLSDDEPFLPRRAGRAAMAERLLPHLLDGCDDARLAALARCRDEYPAGPLGELARTRELRLLRRFAASLARLQEPACRPPWHGEVTLDLDGEAWRLAASFADLRAGGLVRHRYDDVRPADYLEGWIAHLFLCVTRPDGVEPVTRWLARDGGYRLGEVGDARARLEGLVRLYRAGLARPLHFFPKAAWHYVAGGRSVPQARRAWEASPHQPHAESADPSVRLALRGVIDPLDREFEELAEIVFGPLAAALQDLDPEHGAREDGLRMNGGAAS